MTTNKVTENSDEIIIHDRADRRRFMRTGAAFVAVAGVMATSGRSALAADCDRGGPGGEKPANGGNGSDSDTGDNADPTGCGRNQEEPKISQRGPSTQPGKAEKILVAKVTG